MMTKNLIRFFLTVLVLCTMCGCGNDTQISSQPRDVVNIDLAWWGNDDRHTYTMDGVDIFQKENPDIQVEYRYGEWAGFERKNNVWMESNTNADVMQINYAWLSTYSKDGDGYYDMYQLADYIDLDAFDEKDLAYGERNGKLNAIPIAFNTSTIFHNETLYKQYGVEPPKSWDDMFEAAKKFSKDGIYVVGATKKHILLMLIAYYEQTTGESVFRADGKLAIDEEGVGYILDFYKRLLDEKVLMPISNFEKARFADGKCASSLFWISDADNYCKELETYGYKAVVGSYPMAEDAKLSGLYMKPATMYAISDITEHPKEAAMLVNYLLNDETMIKFQGTEKGIPVSKTAIKVLRDNNMVDGYGYEAYEQMQNVKDDMNVMLPVMESESIIDAFKDNADAYIYGVESREDTIQKIYNAIR